MFAPPVAKPQTKTAPSSANKLALHRSALAGRRFGDGAHEKDADATPAREAAPGPSWDLSKITIFPPGGTNQPQHPFPFGGPRLPGPIQTKLKVGAVDDPLEHEADRVADQVMCMPAPGVSVAAASPQLSRKCDACEEEEKLQKKPAGPQAAGEAPATVHQVLRSPGQPLDAGTRAYFEPRFGHDFSAVRVHTGAAAEQSSRDVNADAYTVGRDIVFGAGRFAPGAQAGRRLLAHELTHIVQQAQQPASLIYRKASKEDEDKKKIEVKHHEEQQKRVVQFLSNVLKIKPDPAKGPLDEDNLFHNTAELVDPAKTAKATLKVLTPTHYSQLTNPVYFDDRVTHPQIKGDYPADPAAWDLGLVRPPTAGMVGQTDLPKQPLGGLAPSSPPKEEHAPSRVDPSDPGKRSRPQVEATEPAKTPTPAKKPVTPPVIAWSPAEVKLFTDTSDITEAELKNTFVHEGQHVADWIYLQGTKSGNWQSVLELYKSEFRAFWVQPPVPRQCADCPIPEQHAFPDPDPIKASEKQGELILPSAQGCNTCGGSSPAAKGATPAPARQVIKMKNKRQEAIFLHLISLYPQDQFDCFYVCNKDFRDAVNNFDRPAGVNVVNSARLIDVSIELQKLNPAMTRDEVGKTLESAILALDAIDWAFLRDEKLSAPFWTSVKGFAPPPLHAAFKALAKQKTPPSAKDISQGLQRALATLKPKP